MDYRSHPILKIPKPAESAERLWIVSRRHIYDLQITGFENSAFFIIQKMQDCMMHREPIHLFGQCADLALRLKYSKINWVGVLPQQAGKQENRRRPQAVSKNRCGLFCGSSEPGDLKFR